MLSTGNVNAQPTPLARNTANRMLNRQSQIKCQGRSYFSYIRTETIQTFYYLNVKVFGFLCILMDSFQMFQYLCNHHLPLICTRTALVIFWPAVLGFVMPVFRSQKYLGTTARLICLRSFSFPFFLYVFSETGVFFHSKQSVGYLEMLLPKAHTKGTSVPGRSCSHRGAVILSLWHDQTARNT